MFLININLNKQLYSSLSVNMKKKNLQKEKVVIKEKKGRVECEEFGWPGSYARISN